MATGGEQPVVTLEAVRQQLELMGHQVPDDIISAFLNEAGFTGDQRQPAQTAGQYSFKASIDLDVVPKAGDQHSRQLQRSRTHGSLDASQSRGKANQWGKQRGQATGSDSLGARRFRGSTDVPSSHSCSSSASETQVLP